LLRPINRDLILFDLMQWANVLHGVQLKLLARGEHVAICELLVAQRGQGGARRVMTELCTWANCARVTLELTPSNHWGSDVERLTAFYASLGFEPNREEPTPFRIQESMIRYPVRGRGHVRL
jgi:GNAT superfamily N-acetyltransferase